MASHKPTAFYGKKQRIPMRLADILDSIEEDEPHAIKPVKIFISPPDDAGDLTDEDSSDELYPDMNNLGRHVLDAEAQLARDCLNEMEISSDSEDPKKTDATDEESDEDDISLCDGTNEDSNKDDMSLFDATDESNIIDESSNEEIQSPSSNKRKKKTSSKKAQIAKSTIDEVGPNKKRGRPNKNSQADDTDKEKDEPTNQKAGTKKKAGRASKKAVTGANLNQKAWSDGDFINETEARRKYEDFDANTVNKPDWYYRYDDANDGAGMSPLNFFEEMFGENFELILKETNRHAQRKEPNLTFTMQEIKTCIAILIISGYAELPRRALYWQDKPDVHNEAVATSIPRNKFDKFMAHCHLEDSNNLPEGTKLARVKTYLENLKSTYRNMCIWDKVGDVDEAMIEYFGKYGAFLKQSIRNKPVRFEYKAWCWNQTNGYLVDFEVYEGSTGRKTDNVAMYGLGPGVVIDFLQKLPKQDEQYTPHLMAVDNYFNSRTLIQYGTDNNIAILGTMRSDRVGDAPIESKKVLAKKERGSITVKNNDDTCITVWKDNGPVIMASNAYGVEPKQKVYRWNKKNKTKDDVDCPNSIQVYNKSMGGTDRMDQNIRRIRISIRSKKWWWPLFTWGVLVTLQNSWLLYRSKNRKVRFLDFTREVAQSLLYLNRDPKQMFARHLQGRFLTDELRYDLSKPHLIDAEMTKTRRRCKECGIKCFYICATCEVHLHPEKCFRSYHTRT